ncbi:Crp/Fnr family transcriptional regulator [Glycomyces luteolus]|uniref:Crp/Fnr family transcriptional regulator n=1 Tax=Glycomyces luteolus TaxID=2670330 RepID=A0A9X3SSW6_9ACTN|nr:Crp/Fnr family transcriptional regulator [Glycomyces luteolus]MDA1361649.1 Crp/Fnr family transcriptional regulator [Glycomyces luteolus]
MNPTPQHLHSRGFQALVTGAEWNDLVSSGRTTDSAGGARMLQQGDRNPVVYALLKGRVRVVYTEADGNEALIAVRGPGDLVGEYAQRDQGEHMASVWALEDCVVSALTADAFDAFIRRHRLDDPLQRYILGKIRQSGQRIWRASHLQTEQRMALLLLEIVGTAPADAEPTVPMTQAQIASSLGVALSTVTSVLAAWKKSDLIRTVPAPLRVLDVAKLARHANSR